MLGIILIQGLKVQQIVPGPVEQSVESQAAGLWVVGSIMAQLHTFVQINHEIFSTVFYLILYVPSTNFQLNRDGTSWIEPVLSWDKCVLLKDHNVVTPVRLEPTAPRS